MVLDGGEVLLPSVFHRFWIAGKGWVMARDLRSGDTLRVLGGRVQVDRAEPAEVVPVFNLTVAHDQTYFVGTRDCLVHDNTLPGPIAEPFDACNAPEDR